MPKARFIVNGVDPTTLPDLSQAQKKTKLDAMRRAILPYTLLNINLSYKLQEIMDAAPADTGLHRAAYNAIKGLAYKMKNSNCTDCARKSVAAPVMSELIKMVRRKDKHTDGIWTRIFPSKPFIRVNYNVMLFRLDQAELEKDWNKLIGETK